MEEKVSVVEAHTVEDIVSATELGNIFIWKGREPFDEAVRQALERIEKRSLKSRLKGCENVEFKKGVDLYRRDERLGTFYRMEEIKDILPELNEDYVFAVKSNDIREVLDLTQQIIYLGKKAHVYKEEDFAYQKSIMKLREKRESLMQNIQGLKNLIQELITEDIASVKEDRERIRHIRNNLVEALERAYRALEEVNREVRVAIMATKKSGKSMVVNCLLGEEYAPTSLELATPNIITYIPDSELKLVYAGNEKKFESPESMRRYIKQEFERVNKEGKKLEGMGIYYPRSGSLNYVVMDTPGPDLAGSEHNLVDRIFEFKPDAVVFVIDYTKYAQTSEVELFEKVQKEFERRLDLDTVVCLVNKVDLMFQDADLEKSPLRVAAFIREKFKKIGYDKILVIPTSAMIWFYASKLAQILGEDFKKTQSVIDFLRSEEIEKYLDNEELNTYITQVENFANNIEKTYRKRGVSFTELTDFTGMNYFVEYMNSVVMKKAEIRRPRSIMQEVENSIKMVVSVLETASKDFSEIKGNLDRAIRKLESFIVEKRREIENYKDELFNMKEEVQYIVSKGLGRIVESVRKMIDNTIDYALDSKLEEILKDTEALRKKQISREHFEEKWRMIDISDYIEEVIDNIIRSTREEIARVKEMIKYREEHAQKRLVEIHETLKRDFERLKEEIRRNYGVSFEIQIPDIVFSIDMESVVEDLESQVVEFVGELEKIDLSGELEKIKEGFLRKLGSILFGIDRYDTREFEASVKGEFEKYRGKYKGEVQSVIKGFEHKADEDLRSTIREKAENNIKAVRSYIESVESVTMTLKMHAMLDRDAMERISRLFMEIIHDELYGNVKTLWQEVMKPIEEYMLSLKKKEDRHEK